MSRGKYLSLEEARKEKKLERFAKEHPSEGDAELFDDLLGAMVKKRSRAGPSSPKARGGGSSGTRTRRDTSEDA